MLVRGFPCKSILKIENSSRIHMSHKEKERFVGSLLFFKKKK